MGDLWFSLQRERPRGEERSTAAVYLVYEHVYSSARDTTEKPVGYRETSWTAIMLAALYRRLTCEHMYIGSPGSNHYNSERK